MPTTIVNRPAPVGPSTRSATIAEARPSATEAYTPANAATRRRVRPNDRSTQTLALQKTRPAYRERNIASGPVRSSSLERIHGERRQRHGAAERSTAASRSA